MKKPIVYNYFFFLFMLVFIQTSCSTTKLASDDLQRIITQNPDEGKALVYIVRPTNYGGALRINVACDENDIGSTVGKRFIYTQVTPGVHHFTSKAENKAELFLEVEAGETYFLIQKIKMGILIARNDLEILSESEGRKELKKCKLSGDCPAYSKVK